MPRKKAAPEALPEAPSPEAETKKRSIEFRWIPIDQLVPNSWNPNAQDEITFNLLQDEIATLGLIDPIEVVPTEDDLFIILGGEHRWRAAKNLNMEEVPCVLLTDAQWKDTDLQKFVTVRLNVIHGKTDPDKFVALYNEMAEKYGADSIQRLMGYSSTPQFNKMLGWVKKGLAKSLPKEMSQEIEDRTAEIKSVQDLERIIQELFAKHGETVNQSFMIFTYGKQSHIYVAMDAKLRIAMSKLTDYCNTYKKDINQVIAPMIQEGIRSLSVVADPVPGPKGTEDTGW